MAHELSASLAGAVATLISGVMVGDRGREPRAVYGPSEPIQVAAGEIEWQSGPPSLPEGCEFTVLEGDPSEAGMMVLRLKLPDGYRIPAHSHPGFERVTVLSGTFKLGHGLHFSEEATEDLPAGSFTSMPPGMHHFAVAEGETVIQITTIGPWEINYVNPEDDPRNE